MSLNDNEAFYQKLLWRIAAALCLLFLAVLNVMRYQTLMINTPLKQKIEEEKKAYLFSISFVPAKEGGNTKMIFVPNTENQKYLSSIFSFLKKESPNNIIFINCSKKEPTVLKKKLQKYTLVEASCGIEEENLETILSSNYNVVVINMDHDFSHHAALRAAERLGLKPNLKIMEIKNAS